MIGLRVLGALARATCLAAAIGFITACAGPSAARLEGEPYWNGRLSLTIDSDPPQAFSAGFDLNGNPEQGALLLNSPLGNNLATVRWSPGGAEWIQGDKVIERPTLEALTSALGGTALPVAAMFSWLRGQSNDVAGWQADLSRHADGRVVARRLQPLPSAELRIVFQP